MSLQVWVTLVPAVGALALGVWNARRVNRVERFKSELAREEATTRAKLDYEYDARRRLYERFEPALFQLLELSDYALGRIANLTEPTIWQDFLPAEDEPAQAARRPRLVKPTYSAVSTVYGLFAPLAVVRSMRRQLTLVDLSLEPRIQLQYFLASRLYGSFTADYRLAAIEPAVPYHPLHPDWRRLRLEDPSQYWWQGLTMGRLEGILDLLSVSNGGPDGERLASFGEFEQLWEESIEEGDQRLCKTLAVASNALLGFRPDHRKVFWRVLILQARLYHGLVRTRREGFSIPSSSEEWRRLVALEDHENFAWKVEQPDAPGLSETMAVTERYLMELIERGPGAAE